MDVIIVGGGIAGLAAAIGLRNAGHRVKIIEKSSFNREVGAAFQMTPNASRVLIPWGLDVERARMDRLECTAIYRGDNLDEQRKLDSGDTEATYGGGWFSTHRVDFHSELKLLATQEQAPGKPVEIVLSSEVVDYDTEAGSVTLADSSMHHADLIIGADGIHSTAVSHVFGQPAPAMPTGTAMFRFLLPTEDMPAPPDIDPRLEAKAGMMRIFATSAANRIVWYPCSNNTQQNFVVYYADNQKNGSKEDWHQSSDVAALLSESRSFHPDVLKILSKATEIKRWPLLYRDPIPSWYSGRLVLIGDAAHPILPHQGQGGSQGIEDAAALSVLFSDMPDFRPDTIEARLKLFQKVRMNRASIMQILSNAPFEEAAKVKELAKRFVGDRELPTEQSELLGLIFKYDVVEDCKAQLGGQDKVPRL